MARGAKPSTAAVPNHIKLVLLGEGEPPSLLNASAGSQERPMRQGTLSGAGHVGKTSLLARFIHNTFREDRQATVQAAFMSKQLVVDGQQVRAALLAH